MKRNNSVEQSIGRFEMAAILALASVIQRSANRQWLKQAIEWYELPPSEQTIVLQRLSDKSYSLTLFSRQGDARRRVSIVEGLQGYSSR